MTDTAVTENEPSIEEILDSIKQIISDEDDSNDAGDAPVSASEQPQNDDAITAADDDDVLVLTDKVEPPAENISDSSPEPVTNSDDTPKDTSSAADSIDIEIDMRDLDDDPVPAPDVTDLDDDMSGVNVAAAATLASVATPPAPLPPEPAQDVKQDIQGVLTEKAQSAALEGFSNLVRQSSLERGGITLEDIVRSELNPLLREWLDQYLPDIIERAVKEELQEITKRILS